MTSTALEGHRGASGVSQLDRLLGSLYIGDNVVWHDDAGSLASVFCLNFIQASQAQDSPLIYATFDCSPKNLLDKLGPLGENPLLTILDKSQNYWTKDLTIIVDDERPTAGRVDLGLHLKELRTKRGLSQTELAKLVGVTPSNISPVESNLIYPSLPALMKMAEVLSVDTSSFFQERAEQKKRIIFSGAEAV